MTVGVQHRVGGCGISIARLAYRADDREPSPVRRQWNGRIRNWRERRDPACLPDCVKLRMMHVAAKCNARGRRFEVTPSIVGADDIVPRARAACFRMHVKAVVVGCG